MPGSANGLRKTACMTNPATAREAPTKPATTTRGKQMVEISAVRAWVAPGMSTPRRSAMGPSRAAVASDSETLTGPREIPARTVTSTAAVRMAPIVVYRARHAMGVETLTDTLETYRK